MISWNLLILDISLWLSFAGSVNKILQKTRLQSTDWMMEQLLNKVQQKETMSTLHTLL